MKSTTPLFRRLLGDARLLSFLRWSLQTMDNEKPILSCILVNQELDAGRTLDDLFGSGSVSGFSLQVEKLSAETYRIQFGCKGGALDGDGGEWEVVFTSGGVVTMGRLVGAWLS